MKCLKILFITRNVLQKNLLNKSSTTFIRTHVPESGILQAVLKIIFIVLWGFYYKGVQVIFKVDNFMQMMDIDLSKPK